MVLSMPTNACIPSIMIWYSMVRPGGLILADNTLWDGKVVEEVHPSDKQTKGILVFNEKVKQDDRVEKVILLYVTA